VLAFLGLDHDAARTGLHQTDRVFSPPIELAAGEALTLEFRVHEPVDAGARRRRGYRGLTRGERDGRGGRV